MGPEDLHSLLQEFLDACEQALDTIPMFAPGLGGAPARSFISPQLPAADCDCEGDGQLTVYSQGIQSDPIQALKNHERLNMVQLTASIIRCLYMAEDGGPPDPTLAEQDAAQINADGWALWNHIFNLLSAGQLFTLCSKVLWDGLRPLNPQGGCAGWTLNLRVEYGGYEEIIGT